LPLDRHLHHRLAQISEHALTVNALGPSTPKFDLGLGPTR
jgi:hypothetical protein